MNKFKLALILAGVFALGACSNNSDNDADTSDSADQRYEKMSEDFGGK